MQFTIQSVGDGAFLNAILNGISMLFGAGTIAGLAKVGLIAGLFVTAIQGIFGDGRLNVGITLGGLVAFMLMFSFGSTVVVEDVYTGATYVVSNVPFGIAASGGLISNIGYDATQKLETAFSTPSMTTNGFNNSLNVYQAVRVTMYSQQALGVADSGGQLGSGGSFWLSWTSYVNDCSFVPITLGSTTWSNYLTAPTLVDAIQYQSTNFSTQIQISSTPSVETCTQAYQDLLSWSTSVFLPAYYSMVIAPDLQQQVGTSTKEQIENAFGAIGLPNGDTDIDNFVLTGLLSSIIQNAASFNEQSAGNTPYAGNYMSALEQSAASWGVQTGFFYQYVRPFLTVTEAFAYVLAPFMALAVGLGGFGTMVLAQFLKSLLWIQLWQPFLAVVNMYTAMTVSGRMSAMQNAGGLTSASLAGLYSADPVVQTWVSVAGMLATSIPGITALLVWGGGAMMGQIVGRGSMPGAERFNASVAAPTFMDVGAQTSVQPQLSVEGQWTQTSVGGLIRPGSSSNFTIGDSGTASADVATRERSARGRSQTFESALETAIQHVSGTGHSTDQSSAFRTLNSIRQGNSANVTNGHEVGSRQESAAGKTEQAATQVSNSVGADASVGFTAFGSGVSAKTNATLQGSRSKGETSITTQAVSDTEKTGVSHETSLAQSADRAAAVEEAFKSGALDKLDASDAKALRTAARETIDSVQTYDQAVRHSSNVSVASNINAGNLHFLTASPSVQRSMMSAYQSVPGLQEAVRQEAQSNGLIKNTFGRADDRETAAFLRVTSGQSTWGHGLSAEAKEHAFSTALNGAISVPEVAAQLSQAGNLAGNKAAIPSVRAEVVAGTQNASKLPPGNAVANAAQGLISQGKGEIGANSDGLPKQYPDAANSLINTGQAEQKEKLGQGMAQQKDEQEGVRKQGVLNTIVTSTIMDMAHLPSSLSGIPHHDTPAGQNSVNSDGKGAAGGGTNPGEHYQVGPLGAGQLGSVPVLQAPAATSDHHLPAGSGGDGDGHGPGYPRLESPQHAQPVNAPQAGITPLSSAGGGPEHVISPVPPHAGGEVGGAVGGAQAPGLFDKPTKANAQSAADNQAAAALLNPEKPEEKAPVVPPSMKI
jgi:conjugal transfer mating pair stabilization protein TraG